MNGGRFPARARQAMLVGIPMLSGCVGDFTSTIPAFPDEQSPGLLSHCRDDAVLCVHEPGIDADDLQGILTYSYCVHPDYVADEPGRRPFSYFFARTSCPDGSLLDSPDDDVCSQDKEATCELGPMVVSRTSEAAFDVQITYCDAFACEAGEACSCPECAGNEFCWPTCEHSTGEGTLCDAPDGSPSLSGAWCCPLLYDCAEEPPLTCEPA